MVPAGILVAEILGAIGFSVLTIISICYVFVALKYRSDKSHHISDLYVQILFLTFLLDLGIMFEYFFGIYATKVSPSPIFSGNTDLYILYMVYWYMGMVLETISIKILFAWLETIEYLRKRNIARKGAHPWKFPVHVIYSVTLTMGILCNEFTLAFLPEKKAIEWKPVAWVVMAVQWASLAIGALIVGRKLRRLTKGEFSSPSLRHHWLLVRITILNWCFFGGNLFCIVFDIAIIARPGLSVYISTIQIQVIYQAAGAFVLGFLLWFFNPLAKKNEKVFKEGSERSTNSDSNSIQLPTIRNNIIV